ncbi:MAG: Gfo/Idh/MocA family oxidoreductase [Paraglaciecola sp.]|nr:Gfo/Idh/MocA family oxidoreductase [Paraglaciecola sp.]
MSELKVAVLGAGILGARHARVFSEHPDCNTVAIIDINEKRANSLAGQLDAKVFTNLDNAWEDDFDILVVATPDHLHCKPVVEAVRRGKHVFVEKPLATTLQDADEMVAATALAKTTVMINFSQRFVPEFATIKKLLMEDTIGEVAMILSNKYNTIYVPTEMIGWAAKTSPFMFMSSHDLDLAHWYAGVDPVEVTAQDRYGVLKARDIPVHDGLNVLMQFGDSISANFHASWIYPKSYPALGHGTMEIIGSDGLIKIDISKRLLEVYGRKNSYEQVFSGFSTVEEEDGRLVGAFSASVAEFIDCIRTGREPATSPRFCMPVARAQFAALEALKTGTVVRI